MQVLSEPADVKRVVCAASHQLGWPELTADVAAAAAEHERSTDALEAAQRRYDETYDKLEGALKQLDAAVKALARRSEAPDA